jgi:hypothetical protein
MEVSTRRLPLAPARTSLARYHPAPSPRAADEMNVHALQDYTALAEAQEIMAVPHQVSSAARTHRTPHCCRAAAPG